MNQLIQLRTDYLGWFLRLPEELEKPRELPPQFKSRFLKGDPVISDYLTNGGCGVDFNHGRARDVLNLIQQSLSEWIDVLSGSVKNIGVTQKKTVFSLKSLNDNFTFDTTTGDARLNNISTSFKPGLQPFKLLTCLVTATDNTVPHKELCSQFRFQNTKAGRDKVYGIVKDVKIKLDILPKKSGRNRTIKLFHSLPKYGYRLSLV